MPRIFKIIFLVQIGVGAGVATDFLKPPWRRRPTGGNLLLRFDAGAARSVARPGIAGPALTTSLPPVALLARRHQAADPARGGRAAIPVVRSQRGG
jgi:hypothetical protein